MNGTPIGELHASCQVVSAGTFTGDVNGFTKVAIASSVYTLTLAEAIDPDNATLEVCTTTDKQFCTAEQTDSTTIVVKGWNAAAAATNTAFRLNVMRVS